MTDNTQPEALIDLIDAYAEARHRQGHSSYNAQTSAALQAVKAALAAGQATATQPAPVLWLSPKQFANFMDTDEAPFGKYIPARKTSAGKFTMPLFAALAPAQPVAEPAGAVSEMVKFTDQSAANPIEKARRYLAHVANKKPNNPYFFDDGYPRESIADDAAAALSVLEQLAASHGQASSQAGEYPALVCDYCGALTPDPWHSSGMLHGKMSKHIHSCDACAAREAAKAQAVVPAPPPECETEAEKRAFAFGWFKALESERMKADNKKKDPL